MENRYPEPICDGDPTRRDIFFACLFWIGGAVAGIVIWVALAIGAVRVLWGL